MKAFIDSREPVKIKDLAEVDRNYETKELPQADFYLPEEDVAIERKEASDFASSTTDGRLSKQADRMIAEHEHVYLILEGSPYDLEYSNISPNSVIGMQTSLAVKRGIKIVYTSNEHETLYAVNRVFERHADGEHEQQDGGYVKTADTGEVDDVQVAMLMQIQGISEEKARAILKKISFDELADCATNIGYDGPEIAKEAVRKVDGIGPTLAQRVIDSFN